MRLGVPNGTQRVPLHPSAVSALYSPSFGNEGVPQDTARPAPLNIRTAERWLMSMHAKTLSIVVPAERVTSTLVRDARKRARAGTHFSACSRRDGSRIGPRGPSGMTAEKAMPYAPTLRSTI